MASTTLKRDFTGANGQVNKWTYSFWVKRSGLGVIQVMTAPRYNGNFTGQIKFTSNDQIEVNDYRNSYLLQKVTNRRFRDTNGWYHIVVSNDNTVSSPDTKIYVNGVEETSFATDNEYSQNDTNSFNNDYPNYIGEKGTGDQFDGYMSHFHFIDGTAYTASTFGSTDATTGEWKINTNPTVTYGTNGFFILKDGNSVTDQSGNSNNWTVDSGTLVDTKDNPSNSYSTSNVLDNGADKAPQFSNGNLTHNVGSNVWRYVASTLGAFKGKYYCEVKINSMSNGAMLGAGDRDDIDGNHMAANAYPGGEPLSVGYNSNGNKYLNDNATSYGNSYTANDIIGVAMDIDNGYVYFSKNGTFQDSGDPTSGSSGTGGIAFPSTSSATGIKQFIPGLLNCNLSINYGGGHFGTTAISTNSGNGYAGVEGDSKFNYQPPTGYAALSTKGLNYF
jgi:hypothetical protein